LSQEELAARSYVSVRAVSDLERGVNARPRLHTATALADGLGLEGAERRAFERRARPSEGDGEPAGEPLAVPARARPPLTLDSFVDDGARVDAVLALIADRANRVVSLTGPGGVGKTRLSLEVAARLEGPVAHVALASLDDPALVAAAIGDALGVEHGPTRTHLESLVDHVGAHRLTLVLDNFEQLVDAAGDVAVLVRSCPGVSIVTTTRIPLRITGEVRFPVGPLATSGAQPDTRPDVRLFLARAATSGQGAHAIAGPDGLGDVAELCARLDGVPLAIELAAARAAIIPPAEVLRHLDHVLDLLGTGRSDAPTQQRSMRAALEWSVRLLPPAAQEAFAALGVFAAGASADAAMAVWGMAASSTAAYFDLLQVLTDSHLVALEADGSDAGARIGMFETTRQYARELLESSGRGALARERVAEWAAALVERAELPLAGPDQLAWLDLLDRELPNLRAVARRLAEQGTDEANGTSLRIAAGLQRFWDVRSRWFEGRAWLRDALDRPGGTTAVRAKAHKALGVMHRCVGELDQAEIVQQRGVELYRAAGDELGAAACLNNLAVVHIDRADYEQAGVLLRDALDVCDAHGDERLAAVMLNNLAVVAIELGELRAALRLCGRSRRLLDEQGNVAARCWPDDNLARVLTLAGHPRWAVPIHRMTVRERLAFGDEIGFMWSLEALAAAWTGTGDVDAAGRALGFVDGHRRRVGVVPVPHLTSMTARRREALVARIGAARCDELWDEGAALDPATVRGWFAD
jgi:predicted ATPase/transcriptional regulator with XRE-family HTH domain